MLSDWKEPKNCGPSLARNEQQAFGEVSNIRFVCTLGDIHDILAF